MDKREEVAQQLAAKMNTKYGKGTSFAGYNPNNLEVIPSPSLAFDYYSGIGGFPKRSLVEIYGPPSIGKTQIFGYGALRNAQKMGMLTGYIAVEPKFDNDWVVKNGVNPAYNVTAFPDNLDEAFEIYHEWVFDGTIDYILFDSLVGASTEDEMEADGKARPGGLAKTITWHLQRTTPRLYKNNIGAMFINQVRDNTKARVPGLLDAPGGWALKHLALMRIQVKPGRNRYTMKIDGEDKLVGQEIVAKFVKANAHNAMGNTCRFDHFHIDTDGEYPFGVDVTADIINTAKITKVIEQKASYFYYDKFPDGRIQGKDKVDSWIKDHPEEIDVIRNKVLSTMMERNAKKQPLEVVNG